MTTLAETIIRSNPSDGPWYEEGRRLVVGLKGQAATLAEKRAAQNLASAQRDWERTMPETLPTHPREWSQQQTEEYIQSWEKRSRLAPSTKPACKSRLRAYFKTKRPLSFERELSVALRSSNLTVSALAAQISVDRATVRRWLKGYAVARKSHAAISKAESVLHLAPGTRTSSSNSKSTCRQRLGRKN